MMFKEHNRYAELAAGLSGMATYYLLTGDLMLSYAVSGSVYAGVHFPDSDTKSTPTRFIAGSLLAWIIYALYTGSGLMLPVALVCVFLAAQMSPHRGWTHSYGLVALIWLAPLFAWRFPILRDVPNLCFWGFGIGLLTHYACDSMSFFKFRNWV